MSRKTAWKPSKWYRDAVAADRRRAAAEFTRAPRAMSAEADRKAVEYARWLLTRDGIDVDTIGERFKAEHNAKHPNVERRQARRVWTENNPSAISDRAEMTPRVVWHPSAAGMRPHFVEFTWHDAWSTRPRVFMFQSIELPNWAYEAGEAIDLSDPEAEALAA